MRTIVSVAAIVLAAVPGSRAHRVRFGPGVCGPIDAVYIHGASATGGQVVPMSAAEMGKLSQIIEPSSREPMILWASSDSEHSYSIPVDRSVRRVKFSGTFDTTGGALTLIAPDGSVVQQGDGIEDTVLNCGRIVTVDAPASGTWQVRVSPTGRFWLVVDAKSDRSLAGVEFVEHPAGAEAERLVEIQGEPIAGRPATLRVSVSEELSAPTFQFVSMAARPLQQLDLGPAGGGRFVGAITLPTEPFRVLVIGRDESGSPVQRVWPFQFHGEDIEVVPPPGDAVVAGRETRVMFTIRNHGAAGRIKLLASDDRGTVAVEPPALDIAAGADAFATIRLTIPTDTPAGSRTTISLTAIRNATADRGYNSGRKTLIVTPD